MADQKLPTCQHGSVGRYCPHCDGWPQDSPNNTNRKPPTPSSPVADLIARMLELLLRARLIVCEAEAGGNAIAADIRAEMDRVLRATPDPAPTRETLAGWQRIETAPEADGMIPVSVLVAATSGHADGTLIVGEAERDDDGEWWWANERGDYHASPITDRVRFWMPLPDPPAALRASSAGEERP